MKNLRSISFVTLALLIGAVLQGNVFAAEPSIIVSADKPSYKVGERATLTVTGGLPNTPISWTSWKHDPATNTLVITNDVPSPGGVTDKYGNWKGTLSQWTRFAIGVLKMQAVTGNRKGFITFAVTPKLTVNAPVIVLPGTVSHSLSGGPPNSPTYWETWFNGVLYNTGQYFGTDFDTDANGEWPLITSPFLQPFGYGLFKRVAIIGNHRASVEYTVGFKFTVDKAVYDVDDRVFFSLAGAPPDSPIYWDTWHNGVQVQTNAFYGHYTKPDGTWDALSSRYLPEWTGVWRQRITVGGQQFEVAYKIIPAPLYNVYTKKMGVQLFSSYSAYENDLKRYEKINGRYVRIAYYETCQSGQPSQPTTLTWRAQNIPAVDKVFSNPNIHTYHLSARDAAVMSRGCEDPPVGEIYYTNPQLLTPQKISEIANEYKDFTLHLYQRYMGTGKRFIIGNAESDHTLYGGSADGYVFNTNVPCLNGQEPPCHFDVDGIPYYTWRSYVEALYATGKYGPGVTNPYLAGQNMRIYFEAIQRGIFEGRKQAAKNGWYGVEVYFAPETVSVSLLQDAPSPGPYFSVLNDLLPYLNPGLDSEGEQIPRYDFVSYSAYDAIGDPFSGLLLANLDRLAMAAQTSNVFIGEFSHFDPDPAVIVTKANKVFNDALFVWRNGSGSLVPGLPYVNWWEINSLYAPTGELSPTGVYFKNKLKPYWVEDSIPDGAIAIGDTDGWNWISSNPIPYSGTLAHQSANLPGIHQHFFEGASDTIYVEPCQKLLAYVYLDPSSPPSMVMLQWKEGGSWEHRAYWGGNLSPWGTNGTNSLRRIGDLPPAGQWVRLEVPANLVGLDNKVIHGMAFSLYNGRATWDYAGVISDTDSQCAKAIVACDNSYDMYFNNNYIGSGSDWTLSQTYHLGLQPGKNVLAIKGIDAGGIAALLAEIQNTGQRIGSNMSWKVSLTEQPNWTDVNFDDSGWADATDYGPYGIGPWGTNVGGMPIDTPARWIWSPNNDAHDVVYFRFSFIK